MRFLDSQIEGRTAQLFAHLAEDLRGAHAVRLTDTSWRARDDFNEQLERVLAAFAAGGGTISSTEENR